MIHPYTCENYVKALSKASSPLRLEGLNTWVNVNNIPSSSHVDAQGAYPLTPLTRPDSIKGDMEKMKDRGVVSLVVISDSLDIDTEWYSDYFDFALPYKEHFVIDRSQGQFVFLNIIATRPENLCELAQ